ncbi:MAG: substrate-binding domain-containing protein [Cyanobacteria bacterium J06627_28]
MLLLSGLLLAGCGGVSTPILSSSAPVESAAGSDQSASTITIIGASTPYPALEKLAEAYQKQADVQINFLDSSQSSGGIAAVKEGVVELGTVTRPPKPEEQADNLTYREIARDLLLVAVHPSVENIDGLTTEALQAVYSGKATNWREFGGPDAEIVVLDRAEDTSAKRLLRSHYLGDTLENAPNAIMLRRESNVIEALQNTPYSIGTLSRARATTQSLPINHLSLDGIEPTPEKLSAGQYSMARSLGIVWQGTPSASTQGFIDFVSSPEGRAVLEQAGFAVNGQS